MMTISPNPKIILAHETERATTCYLFLGGIFCACLAIAAGVGSKIISVFGIPGSATLLAFSVTFLITDIVSEVYGKRAASRLVWVGFVSTALVFVLIKVAILWPGAVFWKDQEAFEKIFGSSLRIIVGGLVAYIVSQLHDVWAYHFLMEKTRNKHMWLRNNLSTIVSQAINTVIFISIAFYGVQPIGKLMIGHYIGKVIIAACDTPFIYLGVYGLRKFLQVRPDEKIAE